MKKTAILAALALSLGGRAFGQAFDHETFYRLGWNSACSVAIAHYGYPSVGEAVVDEPLMARIGTLTIDPGSQDAEARWLLSTDGKYSWKAAKAEKARASLKRSGYVKPGYKEAIRPDPVVPDRDLPRLILTADSFKTRAQKIWPRDRAYRWAGVYYNPLGNCALLLFQKIAGGKSFYQSQLIRLGNPVARQDRALAHATNGLLLFERGDSAGALAETRIAAEMAPDYPLARYHYGAMLSLSGATVEALSELEAAVTLDARYKEKARTDKDWESLSWHPRFQELVR